MILWGLLDPTYEWTRSIGVLIVGYYLLGASLAAAAIWLLRSFFSSDPERFKRMGREIVVLVVVFIFVPPFIIWAMEHLTDIWRIILCLLEPECVEFVINFD